MPLPEVTAALAADDEVADALLTELSGLDRDELAVFQPHWAKLPVARRREMLGRLLELAAGDVRLSFEGVFRGCLDDDDADVRRQAVAGLWECEDTWLIGPLVRLLGGDESTAVRAAAAEALGRFALLAECDRLPPDHAQTVMLALIDTLEDENAPVEVLCPVLEAAAALSQDEVTSAIMRAYQADDDRLQMSSLRAMGRSCDASWLPMLLKELAATDAEMRLVAVASLGQIGDEDASDRLADLIYDDETSVRLATLKALAEIGGPEAIEALKQALADADEDVGEAAEEALQTLADLDDLSTYQV